MYVLLIVFLLQNFDDSLLIPVVWERPSEIELLAGKVVSPWNQDVLQYVNDNVAYIKAERLLVPYAIFPQGSPPPKDKHPGDSTVATAVIRAGKTKYFAWLEHETCIYFSKKLSAGSILAEGMESKKILVDKVSRLFINKIPGQDWFFVQTEQGVCFFDRFKNAKAFALDHRPQYYAEEFPEAFLMSIVQNKPSQIKLKLSAGGVFSVSEYLIKNEMEGWEELRRPAHNQAWVTWWMPGEKTYLGTEATVFTDEETAELYFEFTIEKEKMERDKSKYLYTKSYTLEGTAVITHKKPREENAEATQQQISLEKP